MITEKQKWRLLKEGYNPDAIDKMSFEEASDIIGKLPAYKKGYTQTKSYEPTNKPKSDPTSYYVAYAKDIVVAALDNAEKGTTITDVKLMEMMGTAVVAVKLAKCEFEK